jgi:hypothetical protein
MHKLMLLALTLIMLSGCFFVVRDENKVKVYGENKETALDALKKTDETKPEDKREVIKFLNK